jgi:asparagine synthase (glutamine-hydrolysing)
MCAIAGTFDGNGSGESDRRLSRRMTGLLAHRGPDGDGSYHRPVTALDHRRIAIDSSGRQRPVAADQDGQPKAYSLREPVI